MLKGFFGQVFRDGFAIPQGGRPGGLPKGRSARVVVTMGMPAFAYRVLFGAFGVRSLERSVLRVSGVRPVRRTLIGGVGAASDTARGRWLASMGRSGAAAR